MKETSLLPGDAYLSLHENVFSSEQSENILHQLWNEVVWQEEQIRMFGKWVTVPRLTAFEGDSGICYRYAGKTHKAQGWSPLIKMLKETAESKCGHCFNSVLLNAYRNGNDYMGWHRDNEKELGEEPFIASLSFGVTRNFQLRRYKDKKNLMSLELPRGSLLLMGGKIQQEWEHRLPKGKKSTDLRINLTFRQILMTDWL
jgi:alkylated DNA repair dioxygenase AlkB